MFLAVSGLGTLKIGFLDPENPGFRPGITKIDQTSSKFIKFGIFDQNLFRNLEFLPDFELLVTVPDEHPKVGGMADGDLHYPDVFWGGTLDKNLEVHGASHAGRR